MKKKPNLRVLWLQLPLIVVFTLLFSVVERGDEGLLRSGALKQRVYRPLRTMTGWETDLKFRLRGARPSTQKIVMVEIDESSLAAVGHWPWHRNVIAVLIQAAIEAGARVVGLDMVFAEPDVRVPDELAELMKQKGMGDLVPTFETDLILQRVVDVNRDRLVLAWLPADVKRPLPNGFEKFGYEHVTGTPDGTRIPSFPEGATANLDAYNASVAREGYLFSEPDADNIVRRWPLVVLIDGKAYPPLAVQMARAGLGEDLRLSLDGRGLVESLTFEKSGRRVPVSAAGVMNVNFRGPMYQTAPGTYPWVPAMQLLGDDPQIQYVKGDQVLKADIKEVFKDAYVLIGVTAIGANDLRNFPFGTQYPGVEGQATALDNLLSGDPLRRLGGAPVAAIMTVGALAFGFGMMALEALPAMLLFLVVVGGLFGVDYELFARANLDVNGVFLYAELLTLFVATLALKYVLEERSKKFIRGAFSKYLAPAVVNTMLDDPSKLKVGGEKKELTILFSDIRSFSTFSEKMDAPVLAAFLNEYLGAMTDIVFAEGGTLDKYIGDAVMAFWGAPLDDARHAARCCRAARRMMEVLAEKRPHYQQKYNIRVDVGIGINSGAVNVGNMGSETIFEYTVIGDNVNLASRLEGLTKYYRASIVATRFTLDAVEKSGEPLPEHRVLDAVKVKGKKQAVEIVQILEKPLDELGLRLFQEARALYREQKWDEAEAKFREASQVLKSDADGTDGPSEMYIERIEELRKEPPGEGWDGAWEMTSK